MNEVLKDIIIIGCVYLSGFLTGLFTILYYNRRTTDNNRNRLESCAGKVDTIADGIGTVQDGLAECESRIDESLSIIEEIRKGKMDN